MVKYSSNNIKPPYGRMARGPPAKKTRRLPLNWRPQPPAQCKIALSESSKGTTYKKARPSSLPLCRQPPRPKINLWEGGKGAACKMALPP